jgi:sodium-dependent dicarboxylate transporter 2/3/5
LPLFKLLLGPAAAIAIYWVASAFWPHAPCAVAAVGAWMAIWWMTEAIPLAATALLPILCFPLLGVFEGGAGKQIEQATAPYANSNVFLYMGGFILALAIERWGLHRRFALGILRMVGFSPGKLLFGVMASTFFLSMWISNTAAATIMLPIGIGLCQMARGQNGGETSSRDSLSTMLLLSIAYAATMGGMATSVGTPTNGVGLSILAKNGNALSFFQWFQIAAPIALVLVAVTWAVLLAAFRPQVTVAHAEAARLLDQAWSELGPLSSAERRVGLVFLLTAASWILRGPLIDGLQLAERWPAAANIDDTLISIACAISLFVIPVSLREGKFLMDWETARKLPWDVLLLFGGGLSLAEGMKASGLITELETALRGLAILPGWSLILAIVLAVIFLSELASNVAIATAFTPVIIAIAAATDASPERLVVASTLAASCGFMLPVATPPNAIVFGTGRIPQIAMIRIGLVLNLIGAAIVAIGASFVR